VRKKLLEKGKETWWRACRIGKRRNRQNKPRCGCFPLWKEI